MNKYNDSNFILNPSHIIFCCLSFTVTFPQYEVKVTLRSTVSHPVRLGVRHTSRTRNQFFFLLEILFRQLRSCYFVAPSLTRGRVCNLLLLLVLAMTVPLGSESAGFKRLPQPGGPGPRIRILQEQGGPVIPPGTGFPFCRLLRLTETTVELFYPASTRKFSINFHSIDVCFDCRNSYLHQICKISIRSKHFVE
jgi:hypothetical protein